MGFFFSRFFNTRSEYATITDIPANIPDFRTEFDDSITGPHLNLYNSSVETLWVVVSGEARPIILFCSKLAPGEKNRIVLDNVLCGMITIYYRNPEKWNKFWPFMIGMRYVDIPDDYSLRIFVSIHEDKHDGRKYWIYNARRTTTEVPIYIRSPADSITQVYFTDVNHKPWMVEKYPTYQGLDRTRASERLDVVML